LLDLPEVQLAIKWNSADRFKTLTQALRIGVRKMLLFALRSAVVSV
jgi:hypothetical protein